MIRFNFFAERGAFVRDKDGRYRVDFDKMRAAMNALGEKLLTVQGDGDYAEAKRMHPHLPAAPLLPSIVPPETGATVLPLSPLSGTVRTD